MQTKDTDVNGNKRILVPRPTQAAACCLACWSSPRSPLCMAVKLDISLLLEAVGVERYTEKLANNGVVTIEQCAALTEERLKEWDIPSYSGVPRAIRKAKALLSSRDDVVQQELLVSGTSDCSLG